MTQENLRELEYIKSRIDKFNRINNMRYKLIYVKE